MYADDLVVMCKTADDLETFIKTFEKVTQQFGMIYECQENVYYDTTTI